MFKTKSERNYVQVSKNCSEGYDIFIKEKAVLNKLIEAAYEEDSDKSQKDEGKKTESARKVMCQRYYDVRTFGAVMTTGKMQAK
jgi:CRISPR-associated protein Csd2